MCGPLGGNALLAMRSMRPFWRTKNLILVLKLAHVRDVDDSGALGVGGFFDELPKVQRWRDALSRRDSVRIAASEDYAQLLTQFLRTRGTEISRRVEAAA